MVFVSACIPGRQAPRASRFAVVLGLLTMVAAAAPAVAQQSPQTGVQAPPAAGTPSAPGAASTPIPRPPSDGGQSIEPARDGHCSSKTPVA
ncbi:hypothetical protein [Thalassobaculum sp.]|uniref:hypothetical protein n=1 Tax=Thalassobaculum sp. TaxID=2022740 RepID=UPI0032ED7BD9